LTYQITSGTLAFSDAFSAAFAARLAKAWEATQSARARWL
jgi:hypothetical protein